MGTVVKNSCANAGGVKKHGFFTPPAFAHECRRCKEAWVRSLAQEEPLEEDMATHCSVLAWRIPWMEEPGGLQSLGSQRVGQD